jgi:hypothetical protein
MKFSCQRLPLVGFPVREYTDVAAGCQQIFGKTLFFELHLAKVAVF